MAFGVPCILSLIVAVAENGVIGANNDIPWKSSTDMKHFRAVTTGKPVIMGRKTWESLQGPLGKRENIVVTRDQSFSAEGAHIIHSVEAAIKLAARLAGSNADDNDRCEIMVIGGSMIYAEVIDLADRLYHTEVHMQPVGDTYFWSLADLRQRGWRETASDHREAGPKDAAALTFRVLERE